MSKRYRHITPERINEKFVNLAGEIKLQETKIKIDLNNQNRNKEEIMLILERKKKLLINKNITN